MQKKIKMGVIALAVLAFFLVASQESSCADDVKASYLIVTSDTILSGMAEALLPVGRYEVVAILPPGQCPGHYDVKLSDIERMQKADLVITLRGMPFMENANPAGRARLVVDTEGRNWMSPDSYIFGLRRLADRLAEHFPEDRSEITGKKEESIRLVSDEAQKLKKLAGQAGIAGHAVLASSMQKEPLEWMGFRVVGIYGRPESMSARDVARLLKIGKEERVVAVVDNLQSGPEAGKRIAETLGRPHIVLTNFPTRSGYMATLGENVKTVFTALDSK